VIFLAFLLPLAAYLVFLGVLHRRERPLLVSGTWDLIGLLFAASGFLLLTGPAVLSALAARSRGLWGEGAAGGVAAQRFGLVVSVLYYLGVVGGAALLFQSRRRTTAVYNVEVPALEDALATACRNLGLRPTRSGTLYVFGVAPVGAAAPRGAAGAIQAPHHLYGLASAAVPEAAAPPAPFNDLVGQTAILEVDPFAALRHVTLRWDPGDSLLRREVEAELERVLADTATPPSDLSALLTLAGVGLFVLTVVAAVVLLLFQHFA